MSKTPQLQLEQEIEELIQLRLALVLIPAKRVFKRAGSEQLYQEICNLVQSTRPKITQIISQFQVERKPSNAK